MVGMIGGEGYVISANPPIWLTGPTGGPNGSCTSISLAAVNNARTVIGRVCGGFANKNFSELRGSMFLSPSWPIAVSGDVNPTAINETGLIVGDVRFHYGTTQPALWISNDWRELGAPLEYPSYALDINDSGVIVGSQWKGPAMVWNTNGVGYDLNTLAKVPDGLRLVAATAVNASDEIAAVGNREEPGSRAVLLRSRIIFVSPQFRISEPLFGSVVQTNDARFSISEFSDGFSNIALADVIYTLYTRIRIDPQERAFYGKATNRDFRKVFVWLSLE